MPIRPIRIPNRLPTWQCFQDVKPPSSRSFSRTFTTSTTLPFLPPSLFKAFLHLGLLLGLLLVLGLFLEERRRPQAGLLLLLLLGGRQGRVGVGGARRVALALRERPRAVRVITVVRVVA